MALRGEVGDEDEDGEGRESGESQPPRRPMVMIWERMEERWSILGDGE